MIIKDKTISIKRRFLKIGYELPEYINTNSASDYIVYHNYRKLLENIGVLINDIVLPQKRIDTILNSCNDKLDRICSQWNDDQRLYFLLYRIESHIDWVLNELVENELFEAAENLNRFKKTFITLDE